MDLDKSPDIFKKTGKEVILFSIFSILLYQSGYFFVFFLIPLQFLRNKKGFMPMLQASIVVIAAALLVAIIRTNKIETLSARSIIIISEILLLLIILLGFLYINYDWPGNPRMLKKLLIVTAGAFLVGIPALLIYNSAVFQNFYKSQVALIFEVLNRSFSNAQGSDAADVAEILKTIDAETVYNTIKRTVLRSYLFFYFIILSAGWWIGSIKIINGRWSSCLKLTSFSVPQIMVWPLIIALSIVVIDYKINIGFLGYIGWNILLIMVTLYGLRGLGIIQDLLLALNVPRFIRVVIFFTIMLFLLRPGLNYIILIAVPGLGVSEIWINYKRT